MHRLYDRKRNALVYMAISTKIVKGSPMNSISTVPIMRWNESRAFRERTHESTFLITRAAQPTSTESGSRSMRGDAASRNAGVA